MATSAPARALSRLDLPTLGAPVSTTFRPWRRRAPLWAVSKRRRRVSSIRARRPAASAFCRKSISSSGKSRVASTSMRRVSSCSARSSICREKTP